MLNGKLSIFVLMFSSQHENYESRRSCSLNQLKTKLVLQLGKMCRMNKDKKIQKTNGFLGSSVYFKVKETK